MADIIANALLAVPNFLALPFEKNFDPSYTIQMARNNWPFCIGLVITYLMVIFGGKKIMENYKPFDLRLPLAGWNALLCVPFLLGSILTKSYEETVCQPALESYGYGPTGLWVMLFIFSKIPELLDTVFIVLRKKPLIFLHWYHHVTVLLFCWSAYSTLAASGIYFVAMNYSVHALMYGYYCLQALNVCPKSFPAILITLSQIAQMFVGTGVCISCWYFMLSGKECANERSNLIAGALMYASYLYLFCDFAVRRYMAPKKAKKEKKLE
eukprot:scaffold268_cov210-Ochromonas_danica.AAC.55